MNTSLLFALLTSLVLAQDCDLIGFLGPKGQVEAAVKELATFVNYNSDNMLMPADFMDSPNQITISLSVPMNCADLLLKADILEAKYDDIEVRIGVSNTLKEKSR